MSKMGTNRTVTGVLNKALDAGPLKPLNKDGIVRFYCPNCYGFEVYYREVERGVFDVTCLNCNKHWTKYKK